MEKRCWVPLVRHLLLSPGHHLEVEKRTRKRLLTQQAGDTARWRLSDTPRCLLASFANRWTIPKICVLSSKSQKIILVDVIAILN